MPQGSSNISNNLYYYTPARYLAEASFKIELMKANDISIVAIPVNDGRAYYHEVINRVLQW